MYEDTSNPAYVSLVSGGRVIGKVKSGAGGNIPYE